jgi:hypothetical protein
MPVQQPSLPLNMDIATGMLQCQEDGCSNWEKALYSYDTDIEGKRMCKVCATKYCELQDYI